MSDDDLFDHLPDIDWNTIPGLSNIPQPQPDLSTLGAAPVPTESRLSTPLVNREVSAPASTQSSYDEWDAAFLAELDDVEQRLLQSQTVGVILSSEDRGEGMSTRSNPGSELTSRYFHDSHVKEDTSPPHLFPHCHSSTKLPGKGVESTNSHVEDCKDGVLPSLETEVKLIKAVHGLSSPLTRESPPKRHKGKQKASPEGMLKEFLNNFEDEMICPICCDIFAFAHLGNPCGHTFCGECGWRWIKKNREAPSCAICRASLSEDTPMIPNFAVDSAVEKHVQALCTNGIEGWESAGIKFAEWQARKARWKADSTKLMARKNMTANFSSVVTSYALGDYSLVGSDYVEEEAGSSNGGSASPDSSESEEVAVRREPTNRRRAHHRHSQYRRLGGNRRNRVAHEGRGARRSNRRRRRD